MSFFSELKRRGVIRMTVIYVVASWLIMQVAEVLLALAPLPPWFGHTVLAVLAVGFPIAIAISWFYELTPEGLAPEKGAVPGEPDRKTASRHTDFVVIAMLCAAVLLFAWDKWWPRGPLELSVAVLPFENMSADPEQEYFSDGISEEILNLLAQMRPLKVIARTSSFSFKGKDVDIATMAQQLNARHILEGSVRRSGNRVRITAQLIDAKNSSHLWSQTFDRDYDAENLFNIQSEIARAITNRLRMTLTGEDEARLANVLTKNTEAYAAYLLGRQRLTDRKVDGLADAVDQFARAIELDPQFAGAYSGLVDACFLYDTYSGGQINEHCPPSAAGREQLARKAVELDPESGEAWVSLGEAIKDQVDDSPESMPKLREAIAAFERGLELNPNMAQGYNWYGGALLNYYNLYPDPPWGWIEAWKARVWQSVFDKGLEVDPLSVPLHLRKAIYPWIARSKEKAIWHAHRIVEIAPDSPRGYEALGEQAWYLHGRLDESIRWESQALERDPNHRSFPKVIGNAYSALGDPEMALAYYDLAKALTAPDNKSDQDNMLLTQATIRFISGNEDALKDAEVQTLLREAKGFLAYFLAVFIDLSDGRPADALTRTEAFSPECFAAERIEDNYVKCQLQLVRIYQELGNHTAAKDLADRLVRYHELLGDATQWEYMRYDHAGSLATAGRTDDALDVLENLVASGWRGNFETFHYLRFALYFDVTLDAIRDDPRFHAIVATFEADMAQQLENVREMQRRGEVPTLEEVRAMITAKQES